jgi:hypothetical protein
VKLWIGTMLVVGVLGIIPATVDARQRPAYDNARHVERNPRTVADDGTDDPRTGRRMTAPIDPGTGLPSTAPVNPRTGRRRQRPSTRGLVAVDRTD